MVVCYRCGRYGHYVSECYATTHHNGHPLNTSEVDIHDELYDDLEYLNDQHETMSSEDEISDSEDWCCKYCGKAFSTKQGAHYHEMHWCFQRKQFNQHTHNNITDITDSVINYVRGVYVIVLDNGKRYVGKSENIPTRIQQHKHGNGSAWCKQNGTVTLWQDTAITPMLDDLNVWEQTETIAQMIEHGCNNVRGWEFTSCNLLTKLECELFERLARASLNACRTCGYNGHYANQCRNTDNIANWLKDVREAKSIS